MRSAATLMALLVLAGVPTLASSATAPPLKPNEKVVNTKDGCGFVIDDSKPSAKYMIDHISKLTWGGPCVGGLAMGEGWVSEGDYRYKDFPPRKGWLWYGRQIGADEFKSGDSTSYSFGWDGRTVSYNTLSTTAPVWTDNRGDFTRRSRVSDGVTIVITNTRGCILEKKSFPECAHENKFDIPGVMVMNLETKTNQFHACPNPRSAQGCEALWALHAGPVIERIKAFIAENTPKVATAKREAAPLIANWRPSPTSARDDAARHAAIRNAHLAERKQREEKQAETERNLERLKAELAAQRVENERQRAIAEQERKEARRRDRQEAMGILRNYTNTSSSMGNNKPAERLARIEGLTQKPPEGENRVSTAMNTYANRLERKYPQNPSPAANTHPSTTNSPSPVSQAPASPGGQLSPQQISACDTDILNMQRESQRWGGNVNDIAVRLGRYQKELFEGRCAGHPQAAAYIRGAERMLGYQTTGSGNTPSSRETTSSNSQTGNSRTSPSPTRRQPRPHVPDAVANSCLSVKQGPGFGGFVNSCGFKVEYYYCAYRPKKDAWTEAFDCEKKKFGSWTVGAHNSDGAHTKGAEKIHWVACRYSGPDGKPIGISPMDVKWDYQRRTLTFRCGEWGSKSSS